MSGRRIVLTVSGVIPDGLDDAIANRSRPRADYRVLARSLDAEVLDVALARELAGRPGRLVERVLGSPALLAWVLFRRRSSYDLVFTDGEQVGLPYAVLCRLVRRRPLHSMIVHILSVPKKSLLHRMLRLRSRIDRLFVYATAQRRFAIDVLGYRDDQVVLTPFMVDSEFFAPREATRIDDRAVVSSAGLEYRDYPTLIEAAHGLEADVVLAAASPWSKRPDSTTRVTLPENVTVGRLDLAALRELYASSALVVVPLLESDFQAGITTILEAMSMGKAVVCTRTEGQTDTIIDGVNGVYVPPGDVAALRAAVERLLADRDEAAQLGREARRWVLEHADIDVYASRLASEVRNMLASAGG